MNIRHCDPKRKPLVYKIFTKTDRKRMKVRKYVERSLDKLFGSATAPFHFTLRKGVVHP